MSEAAFFQIDSLINEALAAEIAEFSAQEIELDAFLSELDEAWNRISE